MRRMPFFGERFLRRWRSNPVALRDYFVNAFKALPGLKVAFGEQLIRVYVTCGSYRVLHFSFVRRRTQDFARPIQFHLRKAGGELDDRDHHSSPCLSRQSIVLLYRRPRVTKGHEDKSAALAQETCPRLRTDGENFHIERRSMSAFGRLQPYAN